MSSFPPASSKSSASPHSAGERSAPVPLSKVVSYLSSQLNISGIPDGSVNGVQIQGGDVVTKIGAAVDVGLSIIEDAISKEISLLIVHHGIFWTSGNSLPTVPVTGLYREMLRLCLSHGLTIYAAHLPLDAHQEWGNNFVLGRRLGLSPLYPAIPHNGTHIGCIGENPSHKTLRDFESEMSQLPGARQPLLSLAFGPQIPIKVCIVTGSGSDALWAAERDGFDTLITGEPRQAAFHQAKDNKLNVIFGGHYATETIGVQEAAKAASKEFNLPWCFLDHPTGI